MLMTDEIASWQTFLASRGFDPGPPDGKLGPRTRKATQGFQAANGLEPDGLVGPKTRAMGIDKGWRGVRSYTFVEAAHFTAARRTFADISLIVIHSTQGPETPRRSLVTAAWFANPESKGSAHFAVDPETVTQCVREHDVAWGAKGANKRGIHVELCGRSEQSPEEWADAASRAELALAARLVAGLCRRFQIPIRKLSPEEVKAGAAGITGHVDCAAAFEGGRGHWDPGPSFPWDDFLSRVKRS